jgi:glycosyltransferase involved in cell wall biosynthesis
MAVGDSGQRATLIVTVLNESASIDSLLESICRQSRPPDEVVVVDGGSTDDTWTRLRGWQDSGRLPLRLIRAEGVGIARGRNLAVRAATGELIAVTDAGVRLAPDWLEALLEQLDDKVDVVSGFFYADTHTTFELALGATSLPDREDIDPRTFLPSSRSILFRRGAWQRVGGYPEWLDYCEDVVFDLELRRNGCRFGFAGDAIAWFRPRPSLGAFFRQYFLYARGDGKANLWPGRHAVRYVIYLTALGMLSRPRPWTAALLALGIYTYIRRPVQRLLPRIGQRPLKERALALLLVPVIRAVGDAAKMLGYPVGLWWRVRLRGKRDVLWTFPSSS